MANIIDVAKLAGVSATTAKRAFREPDRLRPDTLARVKSAIAQLDYEPDARAGSLRPGKSRNVGLVVGKFVEPFFAELAHGIGYHLRKAEYPLFISENEYDSRIELKELQQLYAQRIGALIIRPGYGDYSIDYLLKLQKRGLYILEVDHHPENSPFDHILLNNAQCVHDGIQYLYTLGHSRIAALSKYDAVVHPEARSKAFPMAMEAFGLPNPEEFQHLVSLNEASGYEVTMKLMSLGDPPTALFALTGTQASGAYRALRELSLEIGKDVSLLAFDDYSWTSLVDPPIDVIKQPVKEMGDAAARVVINALKSEVDLEPFKSIFSGLLIKRGSCGSPRKM